MKASGLQLITIPSLSLSPFNCLSCGIMNVRTWKDAVEFIGAVRAIVSPVADGRVRDANLSIIAA